MATEQEKFIYSVDRIIEAVMFENWLRFYFITPMQEEKNENQDNEEHLFVLIPEKAMKNIEKDYKDLWPMAQLMNNKEITFELSQKVICTYVVENIDGTIIPRDTAGSVMDSMAFQAQLQLFNTWIQLHGDQLEKGFVDFATWRSLFAQWKDSQPGKELQEKILLSLQKQPAGQA
ncbi:MAG: hypothetical protein K6G15_09160 [Desulfovibrio sp.]|nr:hypothetical protein [Desulfovibrio sp.]